MRRTKAELEKINLDLSNKLQQQTIVASNYFRRITDLERQLSRLESYFDRLLDGMTMGMKEGSLPRRSL